MLTKVGNPLPNGFDERLLEPPRAAVLQRRIGETGLAAEFAVTVVVHDGYRIRHVLGCVSVAELPDEMVAHFDHLARTADVLGSDPVRMQLHIPSCLLRTSQTISYKIIKNK